MADSKDAERLYGEFRAKYSLPDLKMLDREFAIGELEPGPFVLRNILFKMDERSDFLLKILGDLIQPDNHIADMHEADSLRDDDKKGVNDLFKKLAYYRKEFLIRELDYDEEHAAGLIIRFYNDWSTIKPDVVKILTRIRDSWAEEPKLSQEFGYFG